MHSAFLTHPVTRDWYNVDMPIDSLDRLVRLSDAELVAEVKSLIRRERGVTADVIAHLAEMGTRGVHLREGYTSLFAYCRDALGLSEWEAYNRIEVARAARRFPVILEMLGEGTIHLTAVRLLAPHLTPENHLEVLYSARGKTKQQVQEIVARLAPRPDVPCTVRKVSASSRSVIDAPSASGPAGVTVDTGGTGDSSVTGGGPDRAGRSTSSVAPLLSSAVPSPAMSKPAAIVTPLSPDRYKLQVTISGEALEMLRLAKDMLGHAVPSGDDAVVLERALQTLLAELARKKFADTQTPRSQKSGADTPAMRKASRAVPAAVKRVVWVRDLGRCAFVGANGHRCDARRSVEFHHVDPYALGGESTVDGIQLRCRSHNDYEGRLYFGKRRRGAELVPEQVGSSAPASTTTHAEERATPESELVRARVGSTARSAITTHADGCASTEPDLFQNKSTRVSGFPPGA